MPEYDFQKINEIIAERILGWIKDDRSVLGADLPLYRGPGLNDTTLVEVPCSRWEPTQKVEQVWGVVEILRNRGYVGRVEYDHHGVAAQIYNPDMDDYCVGYGESHELPLAICLAILNSFGLEIPEKEEDNESESG